MSYNQIESVECLFMRPSGLVCLDVSNNRVEVLSDRTVPNMGCL